MGDYLTEMLVGERGSIRVPAKIVLMPSHDCEHGKRYGLWGVAVSSNELVHPDSALWHEMWECELIIIPKRKYKSHKNGDAADRPSYYFKGSMPNEMLTRGFGNPELWGDEYFSTHRPRSNRSYGGSECVTRAARRIDGGRQDVRPRLE